MLKETETEETIGLITFLALVTFQLGGGAGLATPMIKVVARVVAIRQLNAKLWYIGGFSFTVEIRLDKCCPTPS